MSGQWISQSVEFFGVTREVSTFRFKDAFSRTIDDEGLDFEDGGFKSLVAEVCERACGRYVLSSAGAGCAMPIAPVALRSS